jgi:hypothetical protein
MTALTASAGLGCGGSEDEWLRLDAAPSFAGLEAVPGGWAVRAVRGSSGLSATHSLIVPETGAFSVESTLSGDAALSTLDVVVDDVHYGFNAGDGVHQSAAAGTRPNLDDAYGSIGPQIIPADAVWFKRGDTFRTTFTYVGSEGDAPPVAVEVAYEAEQDPSTGILLAERLTNEGGSTETTRELVELSEVKAPTADTIYEYAAESWSQAVESVRQLSFDAVGLDLPGEGPTMIMVLSSEPGSEHVMLRYSLVSSSQSSSLPAPTVVQVESLAYGPESADLVSGGQGGSLTDAEGGFFRRGDAVVRITSEGGMAESLPGGTSASGSGVSLKTLIAALVPIAQLSDEHFPLPWSYTPEGTTRIGSSGVAP